jgi:hypothetical protein
MTTSEDWAWFVGVFEGEGTMAAYGIRRPNGNLKNQVTMSITMTDRDVVERVAAIVGLGHVALRHRELQRPNGARWKAQWRWEAGGGKHLKDLLTRMMPLLGERRRARAAEVVAFIEAMPGRGSKSGRCGAHRRHHVRAARYGPLCDLCVSERVAWG